MHINVIQLFLILVFTALIWWVSHQLPLPAIVQRIVEIIIVVAAVLAILSSLGIGTGISITT